MESYEKFSYLLRPCKQVERRLLVEALLKLSKCGYAVNEYRYVGFGSVYYADFVLFHKHLYIEDMWCIEGSDIPKRMRFNRPYKFIRLMMDRYANVIPRIARSKRHLIWLDYDYGLTDEVLSDIDSTVHVLAPESIFIVTIDARPRLPDNVDEDSLSVDEREELIVSNYQQWFGHLLPDEITRAHLAHNILPQLLARAICTQIQESVRARGDLGFLQLFNCQYADGATMLTVGGILDTEDRLARVEASDIWNLGFVTKEETPLEVSVPQLTFREKQWLDSNLDHRRQLAAMKFELRPEFIQNYIRFYRDYPTYAEAYL